jgi:hypothetical protein
MIVSRGRCETSSHAAARGAASLLDLGVLRQRHPVAGRQFHPFGVVPCHEPLAQGVAQHAALSSRRLRDERARGVLRREETRRVELDELGVADPAAGEHGEPEGVPGVLVPAGRGAAPDACVPTRGEDHRVGVDHIPLSVLQVESVGAEDDVVPHQDPRDVHRVQDRDVELRGPVDQCALDLQSGVVTDERGPAVGVRAEEPLRDSPVGLAREGHPVAFEVFDAAGGVLGHDPDGLGVSQQIALLERVGRVLLPRVLRVHRRQRRVDAARGERGVRVHPRSFADREHADTTLGQLDGGPQARPSGADDEDGRRDLVFVTAHRGAGVSLRAVLVIGLPTIFMMVPSVCVPAAPGTSVDS